MSAATPAFAACIAAGSSSSVRLLVSIVRALQLGPLLSVTVSSLGIRLSVFSRVFCSAYIPATLFSTFTAQVDRNDTIFLDSLFLVSSLAPLANITDLACRSQVLTLSCGACPSGPLEIRMRDGENIESRCILHGLTSESTVGNLISELNETENFQGFRVLLRADWLHEALLELARMDTVTISRNDSGLLLAAVGAKGTAEILCPCDLSSNSTEEINLGASLHASYSYNSLSQCMSALTLATRVSLQTRASGALQLSCMIQVPDVEDLFIDFVIPALAQVH